DGCGSTTRFPSLFGGNFAFESLPVFLGDNVPHTTLGTATAGMILPTVQIKTVVEEQLLSFLDVAQCDKPDLLALPDLRLDVGIAGVIHQTGIVVFHITIDVPLVIEDEHVNTGAARLFGFFQ